MKMQLSLKAVLLSVVTLAMFSSVAYACTPNSCAEQRATCLATGGTMCEIKYFRCMQQHGCPIP